MDVMDQQLQKNWRDQNRDSVETTRKLSRLVLAAAAGPLVHSFLVFIKLLYFLKWWTWFCMFWLNYVKVKHEVVNKRNDVVPEQWNNNWFSTGSNVNLTLDRHWNQHQNHLVEMGWEWELHHLQGGEPAPAPPSSHRFLSEEERTTSVSTTESRNPAAHTSLLHWNCFRTWEGFEVEHLQNVAHYSLLHSSGDFDPLTDKNGWEAVLKLRPV